VSDETTEERCACGETTWKPGKGWDYKHQSSQCLIGETWVQRSTFETSKLELVKAYVAEKSLANRNAENLNRSLERTAELEDALATALAHAAEWKGVATNQARIIAREVANG
jgi:hypothetical protein